MRPVGEAGCDIMLRGVKNEKLRLFLGGGGTLALEQSIGQIRKSRIPAKGGEQNLRQLSHRGGGERDQCDAIISEKLDVASAQRGESPRHKERGSGGGGS